MLVPFASAAIVAAIPAVLEEDELEFELGLVPALVVLPGCLVLRTLRNAVHILHGFPSGPITMPGGSFCLTGVSFVGGGIVGGSEDIGDGG